MSQRPEKCKTKNRRKVWWMDEDKARRRAAERGMNAYPCYDHWHIGHRRVAKPVVANSTEPF